MFQENDPNWLKPRGVHQRNAGLNWIRKQPSNTGVVYFADDDNTYDLQLFEEVYFTYTSIFISILKINPYELMEQW